MKSLIEMLETLERISEFEDDFSRLKYDTAFYVQEKTDTVEEWMAAHGGGGTVILPNVRISTKKVIEAILEHLELKMDYTTGKYPEVVLEAQDSKQT